MNIILGFLWVEKNNSWTVPEDLELEEDEIHQQLNEIAEYWENPKLEIEKIKFLTQWGEAIFEELDFADLANDEQGEALHFRSFLSNDWIKFINSNQFDSSSAIWTPNNVNPWEWYSAAADEKIELLKVNTSIQFDIYRLGFLMFENVDDEEETLVEQFNSDVLPELQSFCMRGGPYGYGDLNHTCGPECIDHPCIQARGFPASFMITE